MLNSKTTIVHNGGSKARQRRIYNGVRIFPWSEGNAAFKESSKSEVAVEFSRHGASKNIEQTGSWTFNGEIWTKI